ncbi:MAG TPA: MarR family transcriptional regulator [Nocardioides sp.]
MVDARKPRSGRRAGRQAGRRAVAQAKLGLRDLRIELTLLNHRVGSRLALRDIDLDCLDVIVRNGPLSPTALARRTGVHAATLTGVLTRLEAGGWIVRERVENDRRAVLVRGVPDRMREILRVYDGMNTAMDEVCAEYDDDELAVIADFLARTSAAGRAATEALAEAPAESPAGSKERPPEDGVE